MGYAKSVSWRLTCDSCKEATNAVWGETLAAVIRDNPLSLGNWAVLPGNVLVCGTCWSRYNAVRCLFKKEPEEWSVVVDGWHENDRAALGPKGMLEDLLIVETKEANDEQA